MQAESKSPCGLSIQSLLRLTKRMSTGKCTYTSSVRRLSCSITDANLFLKHSYNTFKTSMVHSRKVLRPQNLFSRKPQRYKRRMSRCVDARHLCLWNQHVLCLVLGKSRYFATMQTKQALRITGNKYSALHVIKK